MAQSMFKVYLLILLASSCLLLLSTTLALNFMLEQRREFYLEREKAKEKRDSRVKATAEAKDDRDNNGREDNVTKESKTIRSSFPLNHASDLHLQRKTAPHSHSFQQIADAHLGIALRHIPFEWVGGELKGNALPPEVDHAEFGNSRGVDLVKHTYETKSSQKNSKEPIKWPSVRDRQKQFTEKFLLWINDSFLGGGDANSWAQYFRSITQTWSIHFRTKKRTPDSLTQSDTEEAVEKQQQELTEEERALFHLEQASELGNHHAMKIIANSLASGILPIDNSVKVTGSFSNSDDVTGLEVPDDFSNGDDQLARAISLWHASAMEGNIESAMAMGYRHWFSAMGGRLEPSLITKDILIKDDDVHRLLDEMDQKSPSNSIAKSNGSIFHPNRQHSKETQNQHIRKHSASPSSHYGVLGTCESAMTYYEAAANAIMDELEASSLRGKTAPYVDNHHLPEIHVHGGASSALAHHNKPDELEEALQYYQIRASKSNAEPDVNAAYTLANLYHFGIRGVKQDLTLALKYYETAADLGSWEAAGQAGKFHLWGMGMDEEERDLGKALEYFRKGAPGGVEGCTYRLKRKGQQKQKNTKKHEKKSEAADEDSSRFGERMDLDDSICDHPCVNGMGLLYAFGVPGRIPINLKTAEKYFLLGRDMGNMDSSYNLAMLKLGWLRNRVPDNSDENDDINEDIEDDVLANETPTDTRTEMKEKAIEFAKQLLGDEAENANIEVEVIDLEGELSENEVLDLAIELSEKAIHRDATIFSKETKSEKSVSSKKTKRGKKKNYTGPSFSDYSYAMTELLRASNRGHLQAKHRLAMMYARGVTLSNKKVSKKSSTAVSKSCHKALMLYKEIADNGTTISRRLRAAYKQYVIGDYENSLRNYLAAAETGSATAQINAAFLLERGHCLGLSHSKCMKASVRLWKAAAKQGNEEACLRVGDFYYYGRLRKDDEKTVIPKENFGKIGIKFIERSKRFASTPFWWTRYVLYPEDLTPITRQFVITSFRWLVSKQSLLVQTFASNKSSEDEISVTSHTTDDTITPQLPSSGSCSNDDKNSDSDQTCVNEDFSSSNSNEPNHSPDSEREFHLATAAKYYRKAAEEYDSARANFNLGFMYQWGLGLKQDFPLAKRHYDLARSNNSGKSEVAVKLALFCMKFHEDILRGLEQWNDWQEKHFFWSKLISRNDSRIHEKRNGSDQRIKAQSKSEELTKGVRKKPSDIIISHMLSWETALIIILTIIVTKLVNYRTRTRRQ